MALKKILLITLVAASLNAASALANSTAATRGSNTLIYQITGVKGKALIELPNGQRRIARPGMKIADGSKITVLENSVINGFDIQNKCTVEYRECVDTPLHRNNLCAALTAADIRPGIIRQTTPPISYTPQTVAAAPVMSPTYLPVKGGSFAPYLLGGGALIAAILLLNDDDDDNGSVSP